MITTCPNLKWDFQGSILGPVLFSLLINDSAWLHLVMVLMRMGLCLNPFCRKVNNLGLFTNCGCIRKDQVNDIVQKVYGTPHRVPFWKAAIGLTNRLKMALKPCARFIYIVPSREQKECRFIRPPYLSDRLQVERDSGDSGRLAWSFWSQDRMFFGCPYLFFSPGCLSLIWSDNAQQIPLYSTDGSVGQEEAGKWGKKRTPTAFSASQSPGTLLF